MIFINSYKRLVKAFRIRLTQSILQDRTISPSLISASFFCIWTTCEKILWLWIVTSFLPQYLGTVCCMENYTHSLADINVDWIPTVFVQLSKPNRPNQNCTWSGKSLLTNVCFNFASYTPHALGIKMHNSIMKLQYF